jgi:DNA polymerase III epsilon subunit-like protein
MNGKPWLVLDTETDGLRDPIHVVELSAQLMQGWNPIGTPFHMLLNHDVPIPAAAFGVHGYSREYLKEHGQDPREVYAEFRKYAQDFPIVAHNLAYDWNRCLIPEWNRLTIHPIGEKGFCTLMLARRLAPEVQNYKLDTLKSVFNLTKSQGHRAKNDVLTLVELFQGAFRGRLENAGLDTFDAIRDFSRLTPVERCLNLVRQTNPLSSPDGESRDAWYFKSKVTDCYGPLPARQVSQQVETSSVSVWREGMADWAQACNCSEFSQALRESFPAQPDPPKILMRKTMEELVGLCRGLVADDKLTTDEVIFLSNWLQDAGFVSEWPASEISLAVERVLDDGVVTLEEKEYLKSLIQRMMF